MSNVTAGVLNPFTPLAFLEPTIASQYEVSRYLFAITLGAYGWDICINVVNDYRLLTQGSLRYPTAVYFLSRIFTLGYIMSSFVFQVANVPHCQTLQIVLGIFNVLSQTFTSLLFLFRVVAVYRNQQYVKSFFVILWLCVVGGSLSVPLGIAGAHIGPTMACINTVVKKTTELSMIMPMVNDTAVFAAITYRILDYSVYESGGYAKIRAFFGWQKLVPTVSRNLLQGGQHYYFFALLTNIVTLVLNQLPLPPTYRGMFTIASLALINALACIVYRRIRFGFIAEDGTTMTTVKGPNTYGLPLVHFRSRAGFRTDDFDTVGGSQSNRVPLEIRVVQHKEEFHPGKA
ncbi:hypothetical protein D9757_005576 [Collybiopsis confluens]|uniref:Uncharacterized protein n=1 Tax=Collybiopsis confluens TaxID=2823264 RepID=A0A8H5MCE8_9AGAR|nr:hypothetical protein D9757_005576 [Collybiopsis confluens]